MASLRARHSRGCALRGAETRTEFDGCTCRPSFSIRVHLGHNVYVSERIEGGARYDLALAETELERFHTANDHVRPVRPATVSDVYIAESLLGSPLVKIGISVDVATRMKDLKARPIVVFPGGGRSLEMRLHKRFRHLREVGEWFRREGELSEFIDGIAA